MKFFLAHNIRALRVAKNLTQQDFADNIGYNRSTVGGWEIGNSVPDYKALFVVSQYFQVDFNSLFFADLTDEHNIQLAKKEVEEINKVLKSITKHVEGNDEETNNISTKVSTKESTKVLANSSDLLASQMEVSKLEALLENARKEIDIKDRLIISLEEQIALYKAVMAQKSSV